MNNSENYRSIALRSIIGKVLDNISLTKHANVLVTGDLQFGFTAMYSTTQCTFVLKEAVDFYIETNSPCYAALLDVTTTFDRFHYITLLRLLISKDICPFLTMLLVFVYTNQSLIVYQTV